MECFHGAWSGVPLHLQICCALGWGCTVDCAHPASGSWTRRRPTCPLGSISSWRKSNCRTVLQLKKRQSRVMNLVRRKKSTTTLNPSIFYWLMQSPYVLLTKVRRHNFILRLFVKRFFWCSVPDEKSSTGQFGLRHSSNCLFSEVDMSSVPFLGHLPQDLLGTSALEFYHPNDLPELKKIYDSGKWKANI